MVLIAPQRTTSLLPEAYQLRLHVKSYQVSLEHITRGEFTFSTDASNRVSNLVSFLFSFVCFLFLYYLEESENWPLFFFFFPLSYNFVGSFLNFILSCYTSPNRVYVGRPRKKRVHREAFDRPPAFRREDPAFLVPSRVASLSYPPTLSSSSSPSSFTPTVATDPIREDWPSLLTIAP